MPRKKGPEKRDRPEKFAFDQEMTKISFRNMVEFYKEELRGLEDGSLKFGDLPYNLKCKLKTLGVLIIERRGNNYCRSILTEEARNIIMEGIEK